MSKNTKQKNFSISEKWYFWVISTILGISLGYKELMNGYLTEFIVIVVLSFGIVAFIIWIIQLLASYVTK